MTSANPTDVGPGSRAYTSVADALDGLDLSLDGRYKAGRLIAQVATDARAMIEVAREARKSGFSPRLVRAILSRGHLLADRVRRGEDIGAALVKGRASPEGTRSVHGGREVIKRGGKWVPYNATTAQDADAPETNPAPGKRPRAPGDRSAEIDPEIRERFKALKARAKKAGIRVKGAVHPEHTHADLDKLAKRIEQHEAARTKYKGSDGGRKGHGKAAEPAPEPEGGKPAQDEGIGAINPSAERTAHTPPTEPHAQHALKQEIATLEAQLKDLKSRLGSPQERGMFSQLKDELKAVSLEPSPEAVAWVKNRIGAFFAIVTGAALGAAVAGPAGAMGGAIFGATSRVRKAVPPPPPPPPKRSPRRPAPRPSRQPNQHGHRDGLIPGQVLDVRPCHADRGPVTVKDRGCFELGGRLVKGNHALLSDLYGRKNHGMTVRRYFSLIESEVQ